MKTLKTVYKNTFITKLIIVLLLVTFTMGCSKDDAQDPVVIATPKEEPELSEAKEITSFVFLLTNNPIEVNVVATIDEENRTITAAMPPGTDLSGLLPEVKISELATLDLDTAQDFTDPLAYTVTAEDGSTTVYTVTITALLTQREILQAILDANPGNTLTWDLNLTENLGDIDGITLNTQGEIIDLTLDGGAISVIPVEIGQLTSLEFLKLNRNPLTTLIPEIGQLTNLIELSLYGCDFSQLPPEIGLLTNLKFLGIGVNNLSSIPPEIGKLKKLEKLYLHSNQITSLPAEIGQLTNLEQLRLDVNELTEIPPEIGLLTKLKTLLIGSNQHTELPPEIGQLINLTWLYSANGPLTYLPPEIGQLRNLTELEVYNTQLTSLPPEIGFLGKLEKLNLTQINSISTLPESISYLVELRSLIVFSDNTIPYETTSQKDALISIYSANPGNTLGWGVDNFPEVTFHANGNPKTITMNNKNLTRIPKNINRINSLETLDANSNNLESLPASLGSIETLAVLTLASNQLNTVPPELGQLNNLALLSITNNPITSLPQEVCDMQTTNGGILTILTDPGEGCD
ncbi:leucine-rich repeat domain-containing protein [Maribacter sp. ANRC-HE7]|uniref:Leucine-rich repeat domain-containing protein n=1 Tax=Maribacter aquimaris TaxID=2737171 RepID=A0ABR7V2D5_9FLAO|nr:leucine-rich repeat domain-containing protein [Maribacter aquimaris]MBD0778974.1 leucine-rich repeat domain-containing protein [Maribacter aquimaris]